VLAAVKADGIVLECAPTNLRHDLEVVHAAVTSDWEALRFADDSLRDDKEVLVGVGVHANVQQIPLYERSFLVVFLLSSGSSEWRD